MMPETDLDAPVRAWLSAQGLDVFAEVRDADLVGLGATETVVVELKRRLSVGVIAQALERVPHAHRVYVAVPMCRSAEGRRVCRALGLGLLLVRAGDVAQPIYVDTEAAMRAGADDELLRRSCRPAMRENTGGCVGIVRETPYKDTLRQVVEMVAANGSLAVCQLIASITHHYRSDKAARGAIVSAIRRGEVPSVAYRSDVRPALFVAKVQA